MRYRDDFDVELMLIAIHSTVEVSLQMILACVCLTLFHQWCQFLNEDDQHIDDGQDK